jgi:adenine deaminase
MMEACIYIKNGRIAALRESHLLSAHRTMDCGGRFVIPGLIDAHMHVEPTLLTPEALAELIVPLPIGGLLSNLGAQEVIERVDELNAAAEALGCTLPAPFMTLSFITLPTVPELGLTDKGLIDVKSHSVIPVLI